MAGNVGLGDDPSIPQLMEFMRNAFKPRHFEDAKEVLEKWKAEIELLKRKNDLLILDKVAVEAEMEGLKKLLYLVNRDRIAIKENGLGFGKAEATELILKIIEVENGKSAAEAEAARWKKKYKDLEARISHVENDAIVLGLESEAPVLNNTEVSRENGDGGVPRVKVETDVPDCNENVGGGLGANDTNVPERGSSCFARVKIEAADVSEFNQDTDPVGATSHPPKADIDNSKEAGRSRVFIEISDSDSDSDLPTIPPEKQTPQTSHSKGMHTEDGSVTLKRKQVSEAQNRLTDDISQPSKLVCLQGLGRGENQMAVEKPSPSYRGGFLLDDIEDSDSFSDSDDESVDEYLSAVKNNRKWKDETEMVLALVKDPELCMDAICALYRRGNSPARLACSKHRGFFVDDAPRGTELAEFLIDGDQQGKRRKSIKELVDHDEKGVKDCKRIAFSYVHYAQLFDIYKNREDPFFPSSLL